MSNRTASTAPEAIAPVETEHAAEEVEQTPIQSIAAELGLPAVTFYALKTIQVAGETRHAGDLVPELTNRGAHRDRLLGQFAIAPIPVSLLPEHALEALINFYIAAATPEDTE